MYSFGAALLSTVFFASQTFAATIETQPPYAAQWKGVPRTLQDRDFSQREDLGARDVRFLPFRDRSVLPRQSQCGTQQSCPSGGCCPSGYDCSLYNGDTTCCATGTVCSGEPPSWLRPALLPFTNHHLSLSLHRRSRRMRRPRLCRMPCLHWGMLPRRATLLPRLDKHSAM